MIRLFQGSGSGEIEFLHKSLTPEDWVALRKNASRLLEIRGNKKSAELLNSIPFHIFDATNSFGDTFSVLYAEVPLEPYAELAELEFDSGSKEAFAKIASTISEVGPYIRFICIDLGKEQGPEPVLPPSPIITTDSVERALADAE